MMTMEPVDRAHINAPRIADLADAAYVPNRGKEEQLRCGLPLGCHCSMQAASMMPYLNGCKLSCHPSIFRAGMLHFL